MVDRVERLTNLVALLLETREPLSLRQIVGELDGMYPDGQVARRAAFERDKALLRDIGVPIESEIVQGGADPGQTRYWIDRRNYELEPLGLDAEEQRALQVAVAAIRQRSMIARQALWKLGAEAVHSPVPATVVVSVTAIVGDLREAIERRSLVGFGYKGAERQVEPHGLLLRNGFWYLVGFDRDRGARRTFRIDRIEGRVTIGEPGAFERQVVERHEFFPADPKLIAEADEAVQTALVRIDSPQSTLVERQVGADRVRERHPDGSIVVAVDYRSPMAMRSWVFDFGADAEVLEPADLRADLVAWLEGVVGRR